MHQKIKENPSAFFKYFSLRQTSNFLNLFRLHNQILSGYSLAPSTLVVERTFMALGVTVVRAKRATASTFESGQPDLLATEHTPVNGLFAEQLLCLLVLNMGRLYAFFLDGFNFSRGGSNGGQPFCYGDNRRRLELLLHGELSVAFRTEIIRGRTSKETAITGAENWAVALLAASLVDVVLPVALCHRFANHFLTSPRRGSETN